MTVKVGVIGAGRWGRNHLRVYSQLGCELVGLADVNPDLKKLADDYGIKFFTDYKKLLREVDAVSVVVPTNLHYDVVTDCIKAGKHVMVEKPITTDSEETQELVSLAEDKDVVLMAGYLFRFNAASIRLRELMKGAGDVHYITARYVHSSKPPRKDSGVVFNFAVHLIDILSFILEKPPVSVFCKNVHYLSDEREDSALIILDYGDIVANLEVGWFHPLKKRDMWVICSKEKIYVDFLEQMIVRHPINISYDGVSAEKEVIEEFPKNEPLKAELEYFIYCVREGRKPDVDSEAYMTTKICELCLKSAKIGAEIPVFD
ncbi:MAG: Gfo/Idh/MocA family oxidoreductase [Candidatus Altiarchaeota archaeon]